MPVEYLENRRAQLERIFFYGSVIVVPIGLTLNIIQIKIFSRKDFEKSNIGFLMKIFVYFDTVALVWSFIIFQYLPLIGYDLSIISNLTCCTFYYTSRIIQEIPLFIQAFISFINYLGVNYQSKFLYFKNKTNLYISFVTIIILISLINIPNVFRELVDQRDDQNILMLSDGNFNNNNIHNKSCLSSSDLFHIISNSETALLRSILPLLFITILNVLNIKTIMRSKRELNLDLKREKRFAYVLACLCILYLIFNLPLSCVQIVEIIYKNKLFLIGSPTTTYEANKNIIKIEFIYDCARAWAFIYYGMGFFVNITFNKIFRKNFKTIFIRDSIDLRVRERITFI